MVCVRWVRSDRANGDGSKPSSSAAARTAARVSGVNWPRPFRALEAVDDETPARRATSASVARPAEVPRGIATLSIARLETRRIDCASDCDAVTAAAVCQGAWHPRVDGAPRHRPRRRVRGGSRRDRRRGWTAAGVASGPGTPRHALLRRPAVPACDFAVSPAGSRASSWSIWGSAEPLVASCGQDEVEIVSPRGPALGLVGGCAPAWGPRGELTFVRRGSVVAFPLHGRARVVLPRDWLRRALGLRRATQVVSAAWTGPRGLAVVVRTSDKDDLVAVFAGS